MGSRPEATLTAATMGPVMNYLYYKENYGLCEYDYELWKVSLWSSKENNGFCKEE